MTQQRLEKRTRAQHVLHSARVLRAQWQRRSRHGVTSHMHANGCAPLRGRHWFWGPLVSSPIVYCWPGLQTGLQCLYYQQGTYFCRWHSNGTI